MTSLLASTPDARAVAAAAVRANIERVSAGQEKDVAEILRILGSARDRLVSMLQTGTDFDVARSRVMLAEVDRQMAQLRGELPPKIAETYKTAARAGDVDMLGQARVVLGGEGLHLSQGVSSHLLDFASQASADLVGQITTQGRATINDVLRRGAVGSSRPADIAAALGDVLRGENRPTGIFGRLSTQIERVHRTATADFYENAGAARMKTVAKESPFVMRKRWVAILDARTRDTHREMNGVTVGIDEQFDLDGTLCDGPHDSVLPAEEVVSCRCSRAMVRGERKEGR